MNDCDSGSLSSNALGQSRFDVAQIGLWYGCNYGGILTAYALNRKISQLGYSVILLNHSPLTNNEVYHDERNISYCFMRRNGIPYSRPLYTDADFDSLNDSVNTFVIGSDQVWRWDFSREKGYVYFLDFAKGEKRKIAYAASFGVERETRPEENLRKARFYMQRFDAISVREKSGVDILRTSYHTQGDWMPDPVFLLSKEEYEKLSKPCPLPAKPYLLAYILDPNPAKEKLMNQLAADKGLIPFIVHDGYAASKNGAVNIPTPEQWLYMIAHSSYVFTDSFHGVCFSHIFNKDFTAVSPAQRGHARFLSVLSVSGLAAHLISENPTPEELEHAAKPIEWASVNAEFQQEQQKGERWLLHAFEKERSPYCEHMGNMTYELLYAGIGELDREWETELRLERRSKRFLARWFSAFLAAKWFVCSLAARFSFGTYRHSFRRRAQSAKAEKSHLQKRNCSCGA